MKTILVTAALILISGPLLWASQSRHEKGFLKRQISVSGEEYAYQVFVPEDWTPSRRWPVMLFLHGAGERGRDGIEQTQVGLGPAIRAAEERFPLIVVMPQCRRGVWWNDEEMEKVAMGSLDEAIQEFNGDRSSIYLSGLSMGGYGTLYFAGNYPELFAALAPVCGGVLLPRESRTYTPSAKMGPYRELAEKIKHIPIWMFHGSDDPVVPVEESRRMAKALEAVGASVKLTEFENTRHNSWDKAYAHRELMEWMLSHTN